MLLLTAFATAAYGDAQLILSRGQQVQVIIKRLDWEKDRISLSLRETTANPWDQVMTKYPVGSVHQGRVSRLAAFGAFVTLEPGIDGLLHISKLGAGRRIHHPREVLEAGIRHNGSSIDWVYRGGEFQNHFRVYGRTGQACPICGAKIERIVVGERSTHFCPQCQVLP